MFVEMERDEWFNTKLTIGEFKRQTGPANSLDTVAERERERESLAAIT